MENSENLIKLILNTSNEINETAKDVNSFSHVRKDITSDSINVLEILYKNNDKIKTNFKNIFKNLYTFISNISENFEGFKKNISVFEKVLNNIDIIKNNLENTAKFILELISISDQIQLDTEEIHILATNASIVSSKYHGISGVFEILSDRLNSMSLFINQNIEHIVHLVTPLNNGITNLLTNNTVVKIEIESGLESFKSFYEVLNDQIESINELLVEVSISESKLDNQKKMFDDINNQVHQMDSDSDGAINGSSNVISMSNELLEKIENFSLNIETNDMIEKLNSIKNQGTTIWKTAYNVNEKSKSQLDFSNNSLEFCDSIIKESNDLKKTLINFNNQSKENSKTADKIINGVKTLSIQLDQIKEKISNSNDDFKQFTQDYLKISDIVNILESILKSMKSIGLYSKIEASRNPKEFQGFLTISTNIQKFQDNISVTLPKIQNNITNTKSLLKKIEDSFLIIYQEFSNLKKSSTSIVKNFGEISNVSFKAENMSKETISESNILESKLDNLRNNLLKMIDIVKKPIEGSAQNISRGKIIEEKVSTLIETISSKKL